MWFNRYSFERDPYRVVNPFKIPEDLIQWDRDDLPQRDNFFRFIDDVVAGSRVGLKAYGAIGSGKTWLMRHLDKTLREKLGRKVAVIYGAIPRLEPKFSILYGILVESWNEYRESVLEAIGEKGGRKLEGWEQIIEDRDLAACLYGFHHKPREEAGICEQWLQGIKIGLSDLRSVGIRSPLDSDYRKYLILRKLLDLSLLAFDSCILIVDELENAPPSFARALGDALRDMLDSFSEGFALACTYTAEVADQMLDWGYGEWLFRRLEYEIKLEPIEPAPAPAIFRVHHAAYRKEGYEKDQLTPFTEEGLRRLINYMEQRFKYPGYIFVNCQKLGQLADELSIDMIDEDFVEGQLHERRTFFDYLASNPRLM